MSHFRKFLPLFLLAGFVLAYLPPQLAAQGGNQAALVVRYGDGNVETRCIAFSEPQITGYDLLMRSGLEVVADVQGMGALMCSIGGTGCPADNCLCQCQGGGNCVYWSYWQQIGGNWQYSQGGSSMVQVTHGAVHGWSWGPGSVSQAVPPPATSFETVCQVPATATPPPTLTPTATAVPPTPTPTITTSPTPTRQSEINFSVDAATIPAGSCTNLRWRVANITAVYLNGAGVTGEETREICPQQTESYTLRVLHSGGEETQTLTVTVLSASATPTPTGVLAASGSVTRAATAVAAAAVTTPTAESPALLPTSATETDTAVTDEPSPAAVAAINWITAAPLPTNTPTATAEPTAAALAALPASTDPLPPTTTGNNGAQGLETAVAWASYAIFLAISLALGLLIVRAGRQSSLR
jgi:hypothetical protein